MDSLAVRRFDGIRWIQREFSARSGRGREPQPPLHRTAKEHGIAPSAWYSRDEPSQGTVEVEQQPKETEQLARMERAAQETSDPASIEDNAQRPEPKLGAHVDRRDVVWLASLGAAAIVLFGIRALFAANEDPDAHTKLLGYLRAAVLVFTILAFAKAIEVFLIGRVSNRVSRFNLKRIFRLVVALATVFVTISVLFANWYTAFVSLGLISLILGFSLQMPISSFIAWIYILARAPYRVGDRIKIGEAHGDVIDVSYLDTTLWEFGGEYLWTDHPSGRIVKFPNSTVFSTPVFNYSWPLFPYVWNEIKFQLAYECDLKFVEQTMKAVVDEEVGQNMRQQVKVYRAILAKTPVDELQVREHPVVHFRVGENTWLEGIVRYLVHPKEAGRVKTRLITKMLARMNAEPDRALFPKSNAR
jgi:small-conductance mechanosensitive channel